MGVYWRILVIIVTINNSDKKIPLNHFPSKYT